MSRNNSDVLAKINVPLALLWLAGFVVTAVGYLVMTSSNAAQAQFASSGSQDYATYFTAQSGSTLGTTLMGAGVLGLLLALAAHVKTHPAGIAAGVADAEPAEDSFDDELDLSGEDLDADEIDADDAVETTGMAGTDDEATALGEAAAEPELEPTTAR
ncbi:MULTISPECIES: hypothetical protein [Cryobacterium]|uniref:Dinucleotide-utilizing enzyme n=1 Tax=Cryobacterium mannosilyticum TaxID=1259190 RepID=A0A4R8WFE0_9MICO|nr:MULTISPECIES: hypothetical protein [Cryobacterium]TFB94297.1 hypothetical protein E3O48_09245 [Cryobacterium sp. HLT2-28]TFC06430.1 hypothetical protein E3O32_04980 [Cryobacterium mannosilyticum]